MMDTRPVNLSIHNHPLSPSARFLLGRCGGCHVKEYIYDGYVCNDYYCDAIFHKKCAEAPREINHPFHPQHPLLLITTNLRDVSCDFCGVKESPFYSCLTCNFHLDLDCVVYSYSPTIKHPLCHDHPLVLLRKREETVGACEVCMGFVASTTYSCLECHVYFHLDCAYLSKEVNHPCHSTHPLKLITSFTLDADMSCLICELKPKNVFYHCSICNFISCASCTVNPPPLVIDHTKNHKHSLTLFSKKITFTCDLCGEEGKSRLYICLQCDFSVHGTCIHLPGIININRHDHRISFTHHLGAGYLECGVCHKYISQYKGAYSFSVCPDYAVHSRCAVKPELWDGIELEGIAEDTIQDIAPYKVLGDNLICHFSHEKHPLKLYKDNVIFIHDENIRCAACSHLVGYSRIYACEECCFFLHEKCANLPMKKKLVFDVIPFTLKDDSGVKICIICTKIYNGFAYTSQEDRKIDVHCGSLFEPFVHDDHIHPLYFDVNKDRPYNCNGCYKDNDGPSLRCAACNFDLCFYCATLPEKIWYRNDAHPLTLCCGKNTSNNNWCDICEEELDPSKWSYTCSDCGATLHTHCILGDFSRLIPGKIFEIMDGTYPFEVVLNNHNTRPLCIVCDSRCMSSIILKDFDEDNRYIYVVTHVYLVIRVIED